MKTLLVTFAVAALCGLGHGRILPPAEGFPPQAYVPAPTPEQRAAARDLVVAQRERAAAFGRMLERIRDARPELRQSADPAAKARAEAAALDEYAAGLDETIDSKSAAGGATVGAILTLAAVAAARRKKVVP